MVAYVYVDPACPPRMVMLQFRQGTSWEHRAYWGEDRFPYGANGPTSKVRMGNLPALGRWVRLEVPARVLGLEGKEVNGVALNVYDGDATFDHIGKVVPARDHLWVDDDVPAGSFTNFPWASAWNWTNANPTPFSGTRMHVMPAGTGLRTQALGFPAADVLVGADDSLISHVYLDPANPPRMIILQWHTDSWEHRAYWGEDLFPEAWSKGRLTSKRYMGPLPSAGQWIRLSVPAGVVGLGGRTVTALAFSAHDGRVAWDNTGKAVPAVDYFWVGDEIPATRVQSYTGEAWQWATNNPTPFAGNRFRLSPAAADYQGHFFLNAAPPMYVNPGDHLLAYVYLDPANPPRMVMLQWHDGVTANAWGHRAYWGENLFRYGNDGPPDRCYMGPLPATGQWVRLEVPAHLVGLSGKTVRGMSFDRFGGRMAWGPAGKSSASQPDEVVWLADAAPPGARVETYNESAWTRTSVGPAPLVGAWKHYSPPSTRVSLPRLYHQHLFRDASAAFPMGAGERLFAWVCLDPQKLPEMLMLQWDDGTSSWAHRAYWGANKFAWGKDAPPDRVYLGPLPPAGQWVRLEAPASLLALEGRNVRGMAFSLHDGAAWWGHSGKLINVANRILPTNEWVWVEDALPAGATPMTAGDDAWIWTEDYPPGPLSGGRYHRSKWAPNQVTRTHYFANYSGATGQTMAINPGDRLFCYVYLDPLVLPQMVMLQWRNEKSWEHRAYWGDDLCDFCADRPASRVFMGPLPPAGRWVRLEVPARVVGLESRTVNGMAFTAAGGLVYWDRAGKVPGTAAVQLAGLSSSGSSDSDLPPSFALPAEMQAATRYRIESPTHDATGFHAVLAGEPGHSYRIEVSEDLVNWVPLDEVRADVAGRFEIHDPAATGAAARFYRLVAD